MNRTPDDNGMRDIRLGEISRGLSDIASSLSWIALWTFLSMVGACTHTVPIEGDHRAPTEAKP